MSKSNAEAQARYRARQSLKMSLFERMNADRVQHLRSRLPSHFGQKPETKTVIDALLNYPRCFAGIDGVGRSSSDVGVSWVVLFSSDDPNARLCAIVALAALGSASSFPAFATTPEGSLIRPDDPEVLGVAEELDELKRLGLWDHHA